MCKNTYSCSGVEMDNARFRRSLGFRYIWTEICFIIFILLRGGKEDEEDDDAEEDSARSHGL